MTTGRALIIITLALLAMIASTTAAGQEIFHWIDENGVPNFSQEQPAGKIAGLGRMYLEDTTPPDYDPEQDIYGIEAQAERMSALREDMEKRREESRERQKYVAQQPVQQYRDPYRFYSRPLWYPPLYPKPPHKPRPPIAVPYETSTLKPLGR